ncbi:immunoglobulin I-set domain protein, partial [Cooperia oncophora]
MLLRCRIKAVPSAVIVWSKDDMNVEEWVINKDIVTQIHPDGTCELMNPEVYPEDSGLYKCTATNPHGTAETAAYINIQAAADFAKSTEDASASGESAMLPEEPPKFVEKLTAETDGAYDLNYVRLICRLTVDRLVKILGGKDTIRHELAEEYKLLVKVAENVASALVANVFVDAVREAVKRIMEEESEEEEIEVTNAPRFETCIERYVVKENDTVTISTVVSGDPTPFIEWYFKDQKLHVTEQISMGYENRVATLILKNVTFAQEGTYYCHATNTHGTTVLPSEVKVVPEKAGDTVRISLAKYDKKEGSELLITNIHAHHIEEQDEQTMAVRDGEKQRVSGHWSAVPSRQEEIVEKSAKQVPSAAAPPEQPAEAVQPPQVAQLSEQPTKAAPQPESTPVPPPRKHVPKEQE